MKRILLFAASVGTALSLSVPASAQGLFMSQNLGFYAGADIGSSYGRNACDDPASVSFVGSCEDKDLAWKLHAGYQFHPNAAVEVGFVRLGRLEANGTILGVPVNATGRAQGFELVGLGIYPLTREASIYAKLGLFHWREKIEGTVAGFFPISGKENGTDLTWGLGGRYRFSRELSGRVEWQRYNDVNDTRYDYFGVGVSYHFE
jgi:OOP family OmpA-OmpF porin